MDLLATLGRTLGFSFAAGVNLYATVALIGLASRFGWVALPPQYQAFGHTWVIAAALVLYAVEFLADKIPWVDSAWDAIHTFIRPIGGAAIAVTALGPSTPMMTAVTALVGGVVAGSSHVTKAGTRVMANASPEPFSNWALSFGEDVFVVGLGMVALKYPLLALGVTLLLLGLIVLFAAVIIRAFRRRFGRGTPSPSGPLATGAATALCLAWGIGVVSAQQGAQPPAQPASQRPAQAPSQGQPPTPVFRAGANFVRVDAFAMKDGKPVTDLKMEDFEVSEDGVPQKLETFEHVMVTAGGAPAARIEPRTVEESRQAAADPRSRLFVVFLDTPHLKQASGYYIRNPLINLLNRVIGDDDLVAMMTPEMSARDIQFTRRTDRLAAKLQGALPLSIGLRDRVIKADPVEQQYEECYPVTSGVGTSPIAQEMIERRREKQTLDALHDLIVHLDGLREERKAILLISEGYLLFRENRALAESGIPQRPGIGVGPTGRLDTADRNNPYGSRLSQCDTDRIMLAQLDNFRRFQDLLDTANKANATFYPVDPRGLAVFDSDLGPGAPPPIDVDMRMLRMRQDSLVVAAINTDGVAVINTNNLDAGMKRVVEDLSSYYLMGYSSTNAKLDGRFRAIKVRVKRPGIDVRARRGYRASTEAEVAARVKAEAPRIVDEATAAVERAVANLGAIRANAPMRVQVSPGFWTPPGPPAAGKPAGAEPALWIFGEVDTRRPGGDDWSQGGQAEIAIMSGKGDVIVSYAAPVAATGAFVSRFPRSEEDVWLDPGTYAVRVRVKPAAGGLPMMDTMRFELPKPAAAGAFAAGEPIYARRSQLTGNKDVLTADLRFRRTERIAVEIGLSHAPEAVKGEVLDRSGKPIALPVTATTFEKEGASWVRGEVVLAPLAAGDYLMRLTVTRGADTRQILAPFKVIP
jgi:VWFA-related protein